MIEKGEASIIQYLTSIYTTAPKGSKAGEIHDILELFHKDNLDCKMRNEEINGLILRYYRNLNGRGDKMLRDDHAFLNKPYTKRAIKKIFPPDYHEKIDYIVHFLHLMQQDPLP